MRKKLVIFWVIVLALFIGANVFLYLAVERLPDAKEKGQKLKVVTTLFPPYDFVRAIGGDKVNLNLFMPPGVEAHSFEPKPSDLLKVNQADVFVFTSPAMETWAADFLKGIENKKLLVVDSSQGANLLKGGNHDEEESETDHEMGVDPHLWLDFRNTKIMVENITKAMVQKDAANKELYEKRSLELKKKLGDLDDKYRSSLTNCKKKEIVYGGHYAFGYLANRYNLTYRSVVGFVPEGEPSAKDLVALVQFVKEKKLKYIFAEELESQKISETLAAETGTKILMLNPGHNLSKDDFNKGENFLSIMEKNLVNLKIGLECQ